MIRDQDIIFNVENPLNMKWKTHKSLWPKQNVFIMKY